MSVGISTASFFSKLYTEDSLELIGQNGVGVAEVFLDTRLEYTDEFAKKLARIARKYDVIISSVHAMSTQFEPQLFSIAPRQKKDALEVYEKVLKSAKIMNAKKYVMHGPAMMLGAVKNVKIDRVAPIVDELAAIAKHYDIELCFENVSWCLFSFPEFAKMLIDKSKSDNLCFTLDIKQAIRSGYSPLEYLDYIGSRLGHVHICDWKLDETKKLKSLDLPGKGEFDFVGLRKKMLGLGYAGDIIIEVYSDLYDNFEEVFESYSHIKSLFKIFNLA